MSSDLTLLGDVVFVNPTNMKISILLNYTFRHFKILYFMAKCGLINVVHFLGLNRRRSWMPYH